MNTTHEIATDNQNHSLHNLRLNDDTSLNVNSLMLNSNPDQNLNFISNN